MGSPVSMLAMPRATACSLGWVLGMRIWPPQMCWEYFRARSLNFVMTAKGCQLLSDHRTRIFTTSKAKLSASQSPKEIWLFAGPDDAPIELDDLGVEHVIRI